jgi:Trypsin-like peptidase domain/WD domain, G-beta repeat
MSIKAMIKFSYVLSVALLSANILTWAPQAIAALSSKQVNNIAKQITVRIDGTDKGSGVIVKRQGNVYTVLTNAHVLRKKGKYTVQTQDDKIHDINYQNVKFLPNNIDLATFQFSSDKTYTIAKLSNSDDVFWGDRIYVTGYPMPDKQIAKPTLTFLAGGISDILDEPNPSGYALVYNNPAKKGMSGGPVLNEEGEVVGINGMSHQDRRTKAVTFMGIPINTCIKLSPNTCSLVSSSPTTEKISTTEKIVEIDSIKTPTQNSYRTIAISPDGQIFAGGTTTRNIDVWDIRNKKLLRTITPNNSEIYALAISPDGQTLVTNDSTNTIKVLNLRTGEIVKKLPGHSNTVLALAISPDGKTLVSGSEEIKVWNLQTGTLLKTLPHIAGELAISQDGKTFVSSSKEIKVWNLSTGELLKTLPGHPHQVDSIAISPNGKTLVSGGVFSGVPGDIRIWDMTSGKLLKTFTDDSIYTVHGLVGITASEESLLSVVGTKKSIVEVRVGDIPTGNFIKTLDISQNSSSIIRATMTADGQTLVTHSLDTIKIWKISR